MGSRFSAGDGPIVRLDGVHKNFGDVVALKQLSLDVHRGEFLTLLGPSGCGKTTTLRIISGLEVPDGGLVYLDGRLMNDVPPFRRDVNMVFQNYALFPHLTVFENIAYGLRVKHIPASSIHFKVSNMLERVGLADKARRLPRELSGGQMQRVALARALINEPSVLLLDEPLGALDAKLRHAMQLELRRLHVDLGLTFVCVTHDQEEALVMSDRIAVFQDGDIAQLGAPREIFEKPSSRFVADFIGGYNFLEAKVVKPGELRLPDGAIWAVEPVSGETVGERVLLAVRPQKLGIASAETSTLPTLRLSATVRDIVYAGTAQRVILGLASGIDLVAELPDGALLHQCDIRIGQSVTAAVAREDLILFREPFSDRA